MNTAAMIVVFGKPGAGKTTISNAALNTIRDKGSNDCIHLDLDVCVPQWMRDNFAKGLYPTLSQRMEFASSACDYVESQLRNNSSAAVIVAFSFVNTDLRETFRSRFPHAIWALVDVSDDLADARVRSRTGHFYKGQPISSRDDFGHEADEKATARNERPNVPSHDVDDPTRTISKVDCGSGNNGDNSEWKFAPVDFDHIVLDGTDAVDLNSKKVVGALMESMSHVR